MTEIKRYEEGGYGTSDMGLSDDGPWVDFDDHAAIVASLQEQVRALAEFRGKVRASFHIGELAEDFAVFVNIQNATRRSDCLSAVERKFFTREVPDEDYPDKMGEECDLGWGKGPTEYTEDFRKVLRDIRGQVLDDMAEDFEADWPDNYIDELRASAARIRVGEQP